MDNTPPPSVDDLKLKLDELIKIIANGPDPIYFHYKNWLLGDQITMKKTFFLEGMNLWKKINL